MSFGLFTLCHEKGWLEKCTPHTYTVPIGYGNLGYSGRAVYSDLNRRDEPPSVHK